MNRRHFLRTAGLAIAALGIDPEQLIWQPRQMVVVPARPPQFGGRTTMLGALYIQPGAGAFWRPVEPRDFSRMGDPGVSLATVDSTSRTVIVPTWNGVVTA
jgi:hypothetical protein